jgi:UDP-N-acetylglucosamine diphosphorylase/glucosamine-1-phosphate N-acetyltransferase
VGYRTEGYLAASFPIPPGIPSYEVDGSLFPTDQLVSAVLDLRAGQVLVQEGRALAFALEGDAVPAPLDWSGPPAYLRQVVFTGEVIRFERPWHLFQHCGKAIAHDFALLTEGRRSQRLSALNTVVGDPDLIFLEEGAVVEASILNTKNGPIYIGKDAEVMEGCIIRGPMVLGDHAQLKMGAKVYGPSAFGPECRVGGEVNNSVMLGYSNKGHDGFLGNSVLGEWCNLGAVTNNSNLKNTYGSIKVHSYESGGDVDTGLQFCGLIMGDHAKSGINTMFNTGTVVGVCSNIVGAGFPKKHIPSFSWSISEKIRPYDLEKAFETIHAVYARRSKIITDREVRILSHIYNITMKTIFSLRV